ncbi:hypothetical protein NP493_2749g00001 [Ridgeia piscesae]|uniref:Serpin domain-containing protein n=1 Tax=Ridgeia piscesae TaxID=27915 RepID=A0AAD9JDA3_RIDPI|nr:hypothetical protein NP493_2749g00001 [Ridgeia piscesae]
MRCHWLLLGAVLLLGAIDVTSSYNVWKLARANGNFAFCLYSKVIEGAAGENVFFSPFSISTALSMTYAGARGNTADEMCQVLGFCPLTFNVHATFQALLGSLNSPQATYKLALANGMFVDVKFNMFQSFTNLLMERYSAGYKLLDFNNDAAGSADYINKWVEDRTNGKITDLLDAGQVFKSDLVLVNTIYFKGDWKCQFTSTQDATFYLSSTDTTKVKMMLQTAPFRYAVNDNLQCQILELPYDGCRVSMYILLPLETEGLASLESKLTFNSVTAALANLKKRWLSVGIPKFGIDQYIDELIPILRSMGINLAFEMGSADFGDISSIPSLYVKDVVHKAFINVDETGTEAAAATAVTFTHGHHPPVSAQFLADHPFVFLIRDKTTGSILFIGRYVSPPDL